MRGALAGALMAGLVAGCAVTDAVVTPALDQRTGTTLAERCAGYRADVAAYDAIRTGRELSDFEAAAYGAAQLFLAARCTPTTPPAIVGHWVPEFALVEASPREVLAQACLADWCPLVRPAIAAELGCPPPADPPARGYLHDYALRPPPG